MKKDGNSGVVAVIPCFKVRDKILQVIRKIPPLFDTIICVDDACPDRSGDFIRSNNYDSRVIILYHKKNQGVGGAVKTGYQHSIKIGAKVVVKIDGDGQMNPEIAHFFVDPILSREVDYTKGNRYYNVRFLRSMPRFRLFGNGILSFMTKFSTGYWNIFDPTNGYTAISIECLNFLPFEKIANRYFFESDMLFRLKLIKAAVRDIPMKAVYADEISNLKIGRIALPFLLGNMQNFFKRLIYEYYLRDFNIASILLFLGLPLFSGGIVFGFYEWSLSIISGVPATAGTVMVAALPILSGLQMLLSVINYDIYAVPLKPVSGVLRAEYIDEEN